MWFPIIRRTCESDSPGVRISKTCDCSDLQIQLVVLLFPPNLPPNYCTRLFSTFFFYSLFSKLNKKKI